MKILVALTIVTIICYQCNAETWSINATTAEFPGMCMYEGNYYPPGEFQIKNRCIRLICSQKGWVSGHSCVEGTLEGCERSLPVDIRRPFPECCKRKYKCKHGDGTEYEIEDF